jgi:ABC-type glycerol-3-phosphate transport system substrate-binding protein
MKMQTKTKLISCLIILIVVIVVLFINFDISAIISRELGLNNDSHRSKLAKKAKVKLVFWHAMGGPLGKVVVKLVDQFNETHPDIYVKEQFMGNYDILIQKLISSIISNSQPDISQVYESWTTMIKKGNAIIPLDKYIAKEKDFNKDDMYKVLLENNMYDGKMMSLPFNKSIPVLYYNKDMFKEAGLDPDTPPKTWDEFLEFAKKLTIDSNNDGIINQHGTAITPNALILECMIFQYGGKLLSKDNLSSLINMGGSETALQFLADIINKYKVGYRTSGYNNQSDFVAKKIAMITGSIVSKFLHSNNTYPFNLIT